MRRIYLVVLLALLATSSRSQGIDSAWLTKAYLPRFYVDTGTHLPAAIFIDEKGNRKTLADFKGKILYVDIWATWCGNCLVKFPYQEQLIKRLKTVGLDSVIQFVNINIDDKKSDWKKALKKYRPTGINLYSNDTFLYTKWNIGSLPTYTLLDTLGKVLGKDISQPDEASIDWLLYSAARGVHPVEALWREFAQNKLMEQHRSTSAFTDQEYAKWFAITLPAFLEFNQWRQQHQRQHSQRN